MNQNTQPDYIALAMVIVLIAIVIAMVIRKWLSDKKSADTQCTVQEVPVAPTLAPGSAGRVKLNGVAPKTAAMAMAIVADEMGVPLNELRFISIKEVKE